MKGIGVIIFLVSLCMGAQADEWVWNPDIGWINSRYDPRSEAQKWYTKGQEALTQKNYTEASQIFQNIVEQYPNIPEAKESLYWIGECKYRGELYYEAYQAYEEFLKRYPGSVYLPKILQNEYEIGCVFIQGKGGKSKVLGIPLASTRSWGVDILKKVLKAAPYASFADEAQRTIADYYFQEEEYQEALDAYNKLIQEYPQSKWREFAHYQIAASHLKQWRGVSHDTEEIREAEKKLKIYSEKYPEGELQEKARQMQQEIREKLAQREFSIAMYYLNLGRIPSAKIYFYYIVKEFPGTTAVLRAKVELARLK